MPVLREQLGVKHDARFWDAGGYRLWESTAPGILLFTAKDIPYRTALTQVQRWTGNAYEVTGGSAILGYSDAEQADAVTTHAREEEWARVVMNEGYPGRPAFVPLPVRDVRLTATVDGTQARVAEPAPATGSRTLVLDLTATGAREWVRNVAGLTSVPGVVHLSYAYPQLLPPATALVRTHGSRVYTGLATMISRAGDGTLYGSLDEIRFAWDFLIRTGAVEISLSGSAPTALDESRDHLVEQVREQLFDTLFRTYEPIEPATGAWYALRWKRASDVPDLPISITVEGWSWLTTTVDAKISTLLSALDGSHVQTTYEQISVPVNLVVEPSSDVIGVAVSLDFGAARSPEAPTFDGSGGTRQFLVVTDRPEQVRLSYRVKVTYAVPAWPVLESSGVASLTSQGYRIVLRPGTWVRRHTAYLYLRRGNHLLTADEADPGDYLTVTTTWTEPAAVRPLRTAARITPRAPVEISYPVPPGTAAGRATINAIGMVGGRLVQGSELVINEDEDTLSLLVENGRIQLVGRNAMVPEADLLAERLRSANARPQVSTGVLPVPENDRGLDVKVAVHLVPQPTEVSCWAAGLAMVVSARDSLSMTAESVATRAGMDVVTGYGWSDIERAVAAWDLVADGPRSAMPAEWARLLRERGPLWIVEVGAPYHAVVLGAVWGDGTPEGTYVKVYNPWPPRIGSVEWQTFREFDKEFGLGAGADAAIVHAQQN